MGDEAPRNRKERRAAAKESGKTIEPPSSTPKVNLKMAQPGRSKPKSKTLMDLYEEKKHLLDQGQPFDSKHEDGKIRGESGNILEAGLGPGDSTGPFGQAVFWTVTLSMLHFTLDVLVYNQYGQDILWSEIWKRTFTMLPILFLVIFMLRSETADKFGKARQVLYFGMAVAIGCYTIHVSNKYEYFAVMKQAPPLGTMWIWSVIEMDLPFAVASVGANIVYLWWNGYSVT